MYSIFEELCSKRGISPYRFCKETGTNSSTISTWKKNNSLAGPELSKKVCDYFGITMDHLMTGNASVESNENIQSEKEKRIMEYAERLIDLGVKPDDLESLIDIVMKIKNGN
jgi:transcriptional regulator with XRE-family HTH domain